jgi:dCTP deaminase
VSVVLSDRTIKAEIEAGRLVFDPYDEALVQPSSVDVRVDATFRVFHNSRHPYIDVRKPMEDLTELVTIAGGEPFVLHPGEFVLGQTLERVRIPDDLVARLEGKSSLGRLGLVIHSTAGFVDPGFEGNLTLELSNLANLPVTIYEGMPIGQISFMRMDGQVERPYGVRAAGSKYQGQTEPTASRFYLNFRDPPDGADGERSNGAPAAKKAERSRPSR